MKLIKWAKKNILTLILIILALLVGGGILADQYARHQERQGAAVAQAQAGKAKAEADLVATQKKMDDLQKQVDDTISKQGDQISSLQKSNEDGQKQLEQAKKQADSLSAKVQALKDAPPKEVVVEKPDAGASVVYPYIQDVVQLACVQPDGETINGGSGTFVSKDGTILTNAHVVGSWNALCAVLYDTNINYAPEFLYVAVPTAINFTNDRATIKVTMDKDMKPITLTVSTPLLTDCNASDVNIGDKMYVVGYPVAAGNTLTITDGIIAGFDGIYIKTSAKIDHGSSGGLAIHQSGCMLGIPTMVQAGSLESYGFVIKTLN